MPSQGINYRGDCNWRDNFTLAVLGAIEGYCLGQKNSSPDRNVPERQHVIKFRNFLLIAVLTFMAPHLAKADISYTFIKMTCDPASNSVTIKVFDETNQSGEERSKNPGKDTYYLDDVASRNPSEKRPRKISCEFGSAQKASFVAYRGKTPKDNNLILFINDKHFTDYGLGGGEWTLAIQAMAKNDYAVKDCPPPDLPFAQEHVGRCTLQHVVDGIWGTEFELVDP